MKIKKGDQVQVLTGKDRGAQGNVVSVDIAKNKVLVEGVNIAKRHTKPTQADQQGGIVEKIMPLDVSNVAVLCPKTGEPGRVGYRIEGKNKIRFHKASGEELP
ncbi:50S ribosomal protein L24 [Acidimicrobium ferrooxidans]|uniref:Large ribosomal subunit protein uL24 n=1 Tax=Acidimicrobium ferrooxidans TaxID=53635 RepID=A0ABS3AP38_9ACTN|nr:50S ribosomal protein L24 [Acidimicrobium ferrooxidans]